MDRQNQSKRKKNKNNSGLKSYAKYSGMAFQMIAIILICVYAGVKLDEITNRQKPIFTMIFSLLGVFAALYISLKDFIKKD